MYLIDTHIISEVRKRVRANKGVMQFFREAIKTHADVYISVVTVGELRRGVELIRHRGDTRQATHLEKWLEQLLTEYRDAVLDIDQEIAQLWGRLRAPYPEHALDKLIAATALIYDLTVVIRNERDFVTTGVRVLNPYQ